MTHHMPAPNPTNKHQMRGRFSSCYSYSFYQYWDM